jgi:gamma-glutamylcyclotransferase (GGCT)/AIG2-like uncharacterized protein YtfP
MSVERPWFIFVYGTLKRGGTNHRYLAGQRFLGPARLEPGFTLYSLGEYPGLVADSSDREGVAGELWAVDAPALAALDELEGVAEGLYARVPARLVEGETSSGAEALHPGDLDRVETYLYLRPVAGRQHLGSVWPI